MKKLILVLLAIVTFSCNGNAQKKEQKGAVAFKIEKSDADWKSELSPEAYQVLRHAATEPPFSSDLNKIKEPGTFVCAACGNELYTTARKFESGTGWPSFDKPVSDDALYIGSDNKLGYSRDEVICADCGGHLGHVFNDGPRETTGKRYCMNGVAMEFKPSIK